MSLTTRIGDLALETATHAKALKTLLNGNAADLSSLTTTAKSNLVAALNELKADLSNLEGQLSASTSINDAAAANSTTETYSVSKIRDLVTTSIDAIVAGAPGALNTLDELAAAINDDQSFASSVTTALTSRVRTDTATQGLTTTQQANARANINAVSASDIGSTDTDYVAIFQSGLV